MSTSVGDYTLHERLNPQGGQTEVFRATHVATKEQVVLKLPRADAGPDEQARARRELELLERLDHPNLVRPRGAVEHGNALVVVLEYIPGGTLRSMLEDRGRLSLRAFFDLAIPIAHALQYVHSKRIIHLDLNPSNLMVDDRGQPRIIDFGLATQVRREHRFTFDPGHLLGTLPYLAPEQTGRTNRSVDYRADLYSLGCTFYELLCGRPPFQGSDPLQLVHQHIAQAPRPVDEIEPRVPRLVARIVGKLLVKNAEDRYQSALGLAVDLERAHEAWEADVTSDFSLAADDISTLFAVPELLLGRDAEIRQVLDAFEHVDPERPTLLLVRGYSGVGKSRLVREVQRPLSEAAGYFVSGKFDQFQRHIPFAALRQALRDLAVQLLAEPTAQLEARREHILAAIGGNGALLIEPIPELVHVIGEQPPVPELPPQEARRRFDATLQAFLGSVCSVDQPVAMFLDDLQWIDGATLDWLQSTLLGGSTNGLFLIGAYRDNEVDPTHPLAEALTNLEAGNAHVVSVEVEPLSPDVVRALVAATLHRDLAEVSILSDVVHRRTGGNPFYVTQLLESLHEQDAIQFDAAARRWEWDTAAATLAEASPNVVDLVVERLRRLPEATCEALYVAACLGNRFSTDTLEVAAARGELELLRGIEHARTEGFVGRVRSTDTGSVEYAFLHDRVQQAAFSLVDDVDGALRRRIGWLMADAAEDDADRLFGALQNLNPTRAQVDDRARLGQLNQRAARHARAASAWEPALEHIQIAIELAGETSNAVLERAWCEHLTGDNASAEDSFARALELATTDAERADAYEARVHFFTDAARFDEAYATGREGAAHFGHSMPASFVPPALILDLARVKFALMGKDVSTLVQHHQMTDERLVIGARLAAAALKAAYQIRPELCVHNAARLVQTCLSKGNFDDSPVAYLVLGSIFQGGVMGDHKAGFDWGRLAIDLIDHYDNAKQRAEVLFVYAYFANSWTKSLADTEEYFRAAFQAGRETGDVFHAGCACSGITQGMFMRGAPLEQVVAECERLLPFLERVGNVENTGTVRAVLATARALMGETEAPWVLASDQFDEAALVASLGSFGSKHFAHFYQVDRLAAAVFAEAWDEAAAALKDSTPYLADSVGMQHRVEHHFHEGMVAAHRGDAAGVRKQAKSFARWATRCPANYRHKQLLLDAETARLAKRYDDATQAWDLAAEDARRNGFLQYEGLAMLRSARMHASRGNRRAASRHLREAIDAWTQWGAHALVAKLAEEMPADRALDRTTTSQWLTRSGSSNTTRTTGGSVPLDAASLVRAGQALAQEVRLPELVARMLGAVMESAGAERVVLLLSDGGVWRVQGERDLSGTTEILADQPWREHPRIAASVVQYVLRTREPLLVADLGKSDRFSDDPRASTAVSVLCMPLLNQGELRGVLYLENNQTADGFTTDRLAVLDVLAGQMAVSIANAMLYERLEQKVHERTQQLEQRNLLIRQTFGRYLSDEVVDTLLESPKGLELGGNRKKVTILMSDLRGFVSMSERLTPEQVVQMLNNYLSTMTEIIFRHRGTIDEFIGDAIMVVFGAPFARPDDAERAVRCAIDMQRAMGAVNQWNVAHGLPSVEMGIGLHTGDAVVGNIGSERRTKYGVVGQTVNLASRVESYTVGGQVLISESTHERVPDVQVAGSFQVEPKGVSRPLTIYDVRSLGGEAPMALPRDSVQLVQLEHPIPIHYRTLSGKDVVEDSVSALVVALSPTEAVLRAEPLDPLTNLRVELDNDGVDPIYAKVVLSDARFEGVTIRFTAMPDATRAALFQQFEAAGSEGATSSEAQLDLS